MLNALKKNNSKFLLIGKIKGLANETRRARTSIDKHAAKKNIKGVVQTAYRKHIIGIDTRHHLLAYAFLRGVPYLEVEKSVPKIPTPSLIFKVIEAHAPSWIPYDHKNQCGGQIYRVTEDSVRAWLRSEKV